MTKEELRDKQKEVFKSGFELRHLGVRIVEKVACDDMVEAYDVWCTLKTEHGRFGKLLDNFMEAWDEYDQENPFDKEKEKQNE